MSRPVAPEVLADVAAAGSSDAGAVPVDLLGDFLAVLADAVAAGTPISAARQRGYRGFGERAAREGVALRALLDLYLSAAWRLWPHLPPVLDARKHPDDVVVAGQVMLHAVDDVVAALTEGFQLARRTLVRAQESARREFIDDLLGGAGDVAGVVHRAAGFGLDLSGPHTVAVVRAEREFVDGSPLIASLERSILGLKGDAQALLASKEGHLVVVFAAPDPAAVTHVTERLGDTLRRAERGRASMGRWCIGVGRAGSGVGGVVTAYRDAKQALDLAERLGLPAEVVQSRDVQVYQVLLRDQDSLAALVEDTLGGLRAARGGAVPLVQTLAAYYAAGSNATATARSLHLSVRAVTYRLDRITELTGRNPEVPEDRFVLHVATRGAQLLDWPTGDSSA